MHWITKYALIVLVVKQVRIYQFKINLSTKLLKQVLFLMFQLINNKILLRCDSLNDLNVECIDFIN